MTRLSNMPQHYYADGLAELVSEPTPLTYSFFKYWLTGSRSIGRAMDLLGLPYQKLDFPLVAMVDDNLMVDADIEEKTLYQKTIFSYKYTKSQNTHPNLGLDMSKVWSATNWNNTIKILSKQAHWIAKADIVLNQAELWVTSLSTPRSSSSIAKVEDYIIKNSLPVVIAIGYLAEYYATVNKQHLSQINNDQDWYFQSIVEREKVACGELSFESYIQTYGLRADSDYEISMPRWYEQPEVIKGQINSLKLINLRKLHINEPTENSGLQVVNRSQLLRSEVKRKFLEDINLLRRLILKDHPRSDIANLTRSMIFHEGNDKDQDNGVLQPKIKKERIQKVTSGTGKPVSPGIIEGITLQVTTMTQKIGENKICIFPNASPMYAHLYPQCKGMVFCNGGMTSHGSIVAREYGIPAIIYIDGTDIPEGIKITLNGSTGEWKAL